MQEEPETTLNPELSLRDMCSLGGAAAMSTGGAMSTEGAMSTAGAMSTGGPMSTAGAMSTDPVPDWNVEYVHDDDDELGNLTALLDMEAEDEEIPATRTEVQVVHGETAAAYPAMEAPREQLGMIGGAGEHMYWQQAASAAPELAAIEMSQIQQQHRTETYATIDSLHAEQAATFAAAQRSPQVQAKAPAGHTAAAAAAATPHETVPGMQPLQVREINDEQPVWVKEAALRHNAMVGVLHLARKFPSKSKEVADLQRDVQSCLQHLAPLLSPYGKPAEADILKFWRESMKEGVYDA